MSLESQLAIGSLAGEAILLLILARRRVWRVLPIFCASIAWDFVTDALLFFAHYSMDGSTYFRLYIVETFLDSVVQYLVLIELTWEVLKPVLTDRKRTTLWMLAGLIALIGLLVWSRTGMAVPPNFGPDTALLLRLQVTFAIMRVGCVLILSIASVVHSLTWKRLPFQVITGFAIFSFVSLIVATLHRRPQYDEVYRLLDMLVSLSYVGVLVYWIFCVWDDSEYLAGEDVV